ncbi:TetR/AcrR family transcriptional regulator [Actinocorallia longicatena]|uniref:HTH tetR-type domain-containing protein n=1 Tax=Actinocorallia longicatena TaxID=111803 RepID=A0ABP6QGK4_9ACTN
MSSQHPPETAAGSSGRRAEARLNHERVIAAAIAVFAEKGLSATVPEIAARAGVGKATVYRRYPTKADLIDAVARHRYAWLTERITAAAENQEPDAFSALRDLLIDISEQIPADRILADLLPASGLYEDTVFSRFSTLLEAAKAQNAVRADITVDDIRVLLGGYSQVLLTREVRDPSPWRRYAILTLNALRP